MGKDSLPDCLICAACAASFWTSKGPFKIYKCISCYSAFVWPRPSAERLTAVYESPSYRLDTHAQAEVDYRPDGWADAQLIVSRLKAVGPRSRFLDIGAGEGVLSHVALNNGFSVEALEPNERLRECFARMNGIEPHAGFFDEGFAERMAGRYDIAALSQVLEHLPDPAATVRLLARILGPGGIVFIGVPHLGSLVSRLQGRGDMYITPPEHLNFFSMKGLIQLFRRSGFEMIRMETVSKTPVDRIKRGCTIWPFTALGWRAVHLALHASNRFGMGMVLNGYFRKSVGGEAAENSYPA
jgi:SAM-dependent methyltransferase